ncbi:MAG: cytochrome d ubiquinol oxidase subunit II [Sporomusaceae bacterium]|jgi:cytochrome d ubiquinol oxidase subunit II|nr:cytochrome d ubiquinol oxidase subunit II [Sporomusaceae bacterium]
MELTVLWFILVTVLFIGFFFLEGFDYGVGILLRALGKDDTERRMIINTIGPVWDANETWMVTAGGAMFAAFPHVYATMFSGFYLALFLMLAALIVRGVAFEFRSKVANPLWRSAWDWCIVLGSAIPALLWGVAVTNLIQGIPINEKMIYTGTFFTLLSPYTLLGGLAFLTVFTYHGASYLTLKIADPLALRARSAALKTGILTAIFFLALVALTYTNTDLFASTGAASCLLLAVAAFVISYFLMLGKKFGWAFINSSLAIVFTTIAFFWGLFPRLIVSSTNPAFSLTITNASSSPYTLKIMTVAALIMVPIVLVYQSYTFWIFRKRVTDKGLEY